MNYFKDVRHLTKTERVVSGLQREQLDRVVWEREHVDLVPRYYHNLEEVWCTDEMDISIKRRQHWLTAT